MNAPPTLNEQLAGRPIVVAPGVYDALSALLVERAGFAAAYLSGASIAYTRFGRPDVGLIGMSEVADTLALVTDRVDIPVIVDADTGFGNALNVMRTVRAFERAGAGAIQIEDQVSPKRCGHLAGKALVTADEMTGKVKAALDARHDARTLIIARTDAVAVEGLDAALDRAQRYAEAGADILFVEAPQSLDEMRRVTKRLAPKAPLLANMVEGGQTPMLSAAELEAMGFSLVIFPGGTVRALAHAARDYLDSLKAHGTTAPFAERMFDFAEMTGIVGTDDMLATGKRYDGGNET